jgi:hypothetical protein
MKRSHIIPLPEYYDKYILRVDDIELPDALDKSLEDLNSLDIALLNEVGDLTYAPGKWTIKKIIQHLSDTERILTYRTLLFARSDNTPPAGFETEYLADNSNADSRTITELIYELKAVRLSTIALFDSFNEEQLNRKGMNWKYEMSVLAMGFSIVGHQVHHLKIIEEKYFPLVNR